MPTLDAVTVAQLAQKKGLVTEGQLRECWEELGSRSGGAEPLLNVLERKGYLTSWQGNKLLKGEKDGYFLGNYRLLYKIASGSFGRVFRADDPSSGRVVALKILRRRWSEDPQRIELFEREGRVGMTLRHPNIVEILAVNLDRPTGQYYIVMEFVEGGNLRQILAIRKKLQAAEALRIIEDAAAGLAYAYSRGITHRDMKLTNILISSQGTAKLVDFGLAQLYAMDAKKEGDEKVERTVDYAGLEKATGVKPGDVRSDIYFLGCVFYEMLSGRPPLEMTRNKQVRMMKHRFDNVAPLTPSAVEAPPAVFHLLETMMELKPQRRYQTPAQLLDAIRTVRRELDSKGSAAVAPLHRSVFVVEKDERLQDVIRDKFKELGYRVFMAGDPLRAIDRFRQQPFDGLVVDAGTTGDEGLIVFDRVLTEADRQNLPCAGILVLSEDQADWVQRIKTRPAMTVLVRPVTLKQLHRTLQDLLPPSPSLLS